MSEYIPKDPFDAPKRAKPYKVKINTVENLPLAKIKQDASYHGTLVLDQTAERLDHRPLTPYIWRSVGYLCCPTTGLLFREDGRCVQSTHVTLDLSTLRKGLYHGKRKTHHEEASCKEACCKGNGHSKEAGSEEAGGEEGLSPRSGVNPIYYADPDPRADEIIHSCGLDGVVHDSLAAVVDL